jgi:hypothetical protein
MRYRKVVVPDLQRPYSNGDAIRRTVSFFSLSENNIKGKEPSIKSKDEKNTLQFRTHSEKIN